MKILQIITGLEYGGAERLLLTICRRLQEKGHEVQVLYLKSSGKMAPEFAREGIPVMKVGLAGYNSPAVIWRIYRFIKKNQIDIVHTHLVHADILGRAAAFLAGGGKVFTTLHNTNRWRTANTPVIRLVKLLDRFFLNNFRRSRAIAVSRAVREFFVEHEGLNREKIEVINNFPGSHKQGKESTLARKELAIGKEDFLLLNIGRLEELKGQIYLLQALDKLVNRKDYQDIRCIILGEGSKKEELEDYISEHQLQNHVFLPGVTPEVGRYYALADLFVLSSLWEGLPLVILEAFASGLPVLATRAGGVGEVVREGETGFLVPAGDGQALAEAIERLYQGREGLEMVAARARALQEEEYSADNYLKRLLMLYQAEPVSYD